MTLGDSVAQRARKVACIGSAAQRFVDKVVVMDNNRRKWKSGKHLAKKTRAVLL